MKKQLLLIGSLTLLGVLVCGSIIMFSLMYTRWMNESNEKSNTTTHYSTEHEAIYYRIVSKYVTKVDGKRCYKILVKYFDGSVESKSVDYKDYESYKCGQIIKEE